MNPGGSGAAAQAAGAAWLVTLGVGYVLLPFLRRRHCGQSIRADGPAAHLQKAGTPTAGGVFFLLGLSAALAGSLWSNRIMSLLLFVFLSFGLLGLTDDMLKIRRRQNLGLRAWQKLAAEIVLAALFAWLAIGWAGRGTTLLVPFLGLVDLGGFYPLLVVLIVVAASNAVNLTDGLDGLAAGSVIFSALGYAGACLFFSGALLLTPLQAGAAPVLFAAALTGGCFGFLWFNRYPAKVFMGDCGSLALGGALAGLAVLTGAELFLLPLGLVYVVETLSVILQVISFQTRGKRIFRMAPLHHHFELGGWSEKKVVRLFWAAAAGGVALTWLLLRLTADWLAAGNGG
ncbi:MAG: phospho-N-acetylmuramoyl-pentapeptide-transferase [Gracilibacteraceae bacterium]|nr:phospho-N-acetylmuramoyl-pentapeptide-transferase [Gracilibacteraceae bacterium]